MDFAWTQEQQELSHSLRTIAQAISHDDQRQAQGDFWTRAQWRRCAEAGLLGLCVSQAYGGGGYDALTTALALEAFGFGCEDTGLVFSAAAHLLACTMPIVEAGSDSLKESFLPGLCAGRFVGGNAITEDDAGSDVFALHTRAVREGDEYVLDGCKSYVSNGPVADVFVVYARTNPAHGYLGISAFVVERTTPGLILGEPFTKMGLTSTPACRVSFEGCRVPASHRLGKEGQGASLFKRSMLWERACLFALYLGVMERQLERTIHYARERRQFGKPIGRNQAVAHRVADMKLRLEMSRLLLYRSCWLFGRGEPATLEIALSKLAVSSAAVQGGLDALHIHGARGIDCDYGIERMLRDAIPGTLFSGTAEMQRDIIANELGL
ncbi:acyl-CoA dehydrogenase family protein [Ktedonobacter robiniae]|uniref:Acyl-CoA dehydrogenase n=1 Tax=Ktedonobacter robiniae TaxID=2778365 RepID=A0ABQ3V5V0_9CHLR|nr:acyl-CoA dehydrogenase family protein [Ktedonobacter robiniae]GHO60137.1 acyl-CoA dehydrogenase [Ktedonobacter robiniae]